MSAGRQPEEDRSQCTPCRGTGRLISAKGGTRHEVTCAWCGGSGRFQPGRDAQAEGGRDALAGDGRDAQAEGGRDAQGEGGGAAAPETPAGEA